MPSLKKQLHPPNLRVCPNVLREFFPKFDDVYEIIAFNTGLKTMVSSGSSSRPLVVVNDVDVHPFFMSVFSAKLSTVFSCAEALFLGMVKAVAQNAPSGDAILNQSDSTVKPSTEKMESLRKINSNGEKAMGSAAQRYCARSDGRGRANARKSITLASFENDMFSIFESKSSAVEISPGDLSGSSSTGLDLGSSLQSLLSNIAEE